MTAVAAAPPGTQAAGLAGSCPAVNSLPGPPNESPTTCRDSAIPTVTPTGARLALCWARVFRPSSPGRSAARLPGAGCQPGRVSPAA